MKRVGFIGLGIMGHAMAHHLIRAGYELTVTTRTRSKAEGLLDAGAVWADTAADCARGADFVVTMVGTPDEVRAVYFDQDGVFAGASAGAILIDMSTSSPALAREINDLAVSSGMFALDAPVTGGANGAKEGTLTIMVGGDASAFERSRPLFEAMGRLIIHEGEAGMGQQTKMANQIAVAGAVAATCEAIAYGEACGLDLDKLLQTLSSGTGFSQQMKYCAPKIFEGDMAAGFYVKHFYKDMGLAQADAQAHGLHLSVMGQVLSLYRRLMDEGKGELGYQALIDAVRSGTYPADADS